MEQQVRINRFDEDDPKCVYCDSPYLRSLGNCNGRRRYRCQDCKKAFLGEVYTPLVIRHEVNEKDPVCVYCENSKLAKNGLYGNRQRYKCKRCNSFFKGQAVTREGKQIANFCNSGKTLCIYCGSSKVRRNGTQSNKQTYKCFSCEKHFRKEINIVEVPKVDSKNPKCVHCNSSNLIKTGICKDNNKQKYYCKDCNKNFLGTYYVKQERPFAFDGIQCLRCKSRNVKKTSICPKTKRQMYVCNLCGRNFSEGAENKSARYVLPKDITLETMFDYDLWDCRVLGLEADERNSYTFSFSKIEPQWLKIGAKYWIKYRASIGETKKTIGSRLTGLRKFSLFLKEKNIDISPENIDRDFIVNYFIYLSSQKFAESYRVHLIGTLKAFIEDCVRFSWLPFKEKPLIYSDDFPKIPKALPRYIPDEVIAQIKDNYDALPKTIVCMIEVLLNTGMRVSELVRLKYNCLEQDSTGDYWLKVYQAKMKKEISVVISHELAKLIHEQQKYVRQELKENWQHLFCDSKYRGDYRDFERKSEWSDKPLKPLNQYFPRPVKLMPDTLRGYLRRFVAEKEIKDKSGNLFSLSAVHQFRHTHGTELINNGVSQIVVQKRLGHSSPRMTNVYAHIHDKTMKQEMEKFWDGRVLNNQGEVVVSANPELDTVEMQWVKKNMKAQSLPDGFCGLPITKDCPVQGSPCLSCSHFRTSIEFLDNHKKRLEDTEKLIENARVNGWNRQVETNLPIAENLKKIIRGLEQKEVVYGDENFPKQEGGEQNA